MEKFNYKSRVIIEQSLSEEDFKDVEKLIEICNKRHNTDLKLYLDREAENITKFLFYDERDLIAYFGMTLSYNVGEAYIWGTINPDCKTKDIFSEIFKSVKDRCRENNVDTLKFINKRDVTSFREFIIYVGGEEKYSTYEMKFNRKYYKELSGECTNLVLSKASLEDLDEIVPIGIEAFGTTEKDERAYNESNLNNSKYSNFIGKIHNTTVGIISARIENGEGSIADLAVQKSYRGKGFGRAILSKTIAYLLNERIENFTLSVEMENRKALSIYEDSGFRAVSVSDCYEVKF
ncbi:GNAT family N-acetyltransferase [Clostridium sp. UBA6640]|uniref:GNAT family N-acetyltransferase n=1 Tax=Clostridium sp. UBA6640 TaxID=1946370 RepID=UPI0025C0D7B3|nr:GNAT family N-acetyltransferase [Clostridium sp. UBA6640]